MKKFVVGLVLSLCGACDREEASPTEAVSNSVSAVASAAPPTTASARQGKPVDACAVLTEQMVRTHLGVADDVTIEQRSSKHSRHPHCSYSWSTLTEEEQKKQQAEMMKRVRANMQKGKLAGGLLEAAHMGSEEAHLTLVKDEFESEKAAQARLSSIRKMMERGMKRKVKSETVEFKSSYQTVDGVGDKAYWSKKQNQLSVAEGKRLFHVGVKAKDEAKNLDLAKALARAIIDKT